MTYPITNNPVPSNDPADDVQPMQDNFNNIKGYLTVDHVAPGTVGAGWHKEVTYNDKNVPGALPTGQITVAYTGPGVIDSAVPQHFWNNASGIYPLSAIKAFGVFTTTATAGAVTINNQHNVVSVTSSSSGTSYAVVLTAGCISGDDVCVFTNLSNNGTTTWSFTNPTLTLTTNAGSASGVKYSFVILQI